MCSCELSSLARVFFWKEGGRLTLKLFFSFFFLVYSRAGVWSLSVSPFVVSYMLRDSTPRLSVESLSTFRAVCLLSRFLSL